MPLEQSNSRKAISHNISAESRASKPHKQAVAIALNVARKHGGYAAGLYSGQTEYEARYAGEPGDPQQPQTPQNFGPPQPSPGQDITRQTDTNDAARSVTSPLGTPREAQGISRARRAYEEVGRVPSSTVKPGLGTESQSVLRSWPPGLGQNIEVEAPPRRNRVYDLYNLPQPGEAQGQPTRRPDMSIATTSRSPSEMAKQPVKPVPWTFKERPAAEVDAARKPVQESAQEYDMDSYESRYGSYAADERKGWQMREPNAEESLGIKKGQDYEAGADEEEQSTHEPRKEKPKSTHVPSGHMPGRQLAPRGHMPKSFVNDSLKALRNRHRGDYAGDPREQLPKSLPTDERGKSPQGGINVPLLKKIGQSVATHGHFVHGGPKVPGEHHDEQADSYESQYGSFHFHSFAELDGRTRHGTPDSQATRDGPGCQEIVDAETSPQRQRTMGDEKRLQEHLR